MPRDFALFPAQASTLASQVDALFFFLVAVSVVFIVLIFGLLLVFVVTYRRRSTEDRPVQILGDFRLELAWTVIPLGIFLVAFGWGARVYMTSRQPPAQALEIYVVGKQWMWKFQHAHGKREINTLHVPVGRPVKLTMTSEDVIHSWFVPAFRVKMDVVPGRYTTAWFEATRTGTYHLFCAEYCGTEHSGMIGQVVVLAPSQYERWLQGAGGGTPLAASGADLFQQLRCHTCHRTDGLRRGPALAGLFGTTVTLQTGHQVLADEGYLRESILQPAAKIVAGYQALMPTYQGQISEEGLVQMIDYLKSLARPTEATG